MIILPVVNRTAVNLPPCLLLETEIESSCIDTVRRVRVISLTPISYTRSSKIECSISVHGTCYVGGSFVAVFGPLSQGAVTP